MVWSPPQVGRHRIPRCIPTLLFAAILNGLIGCASFAGLGNSSAYTATDGGSDEAPVFDDEPRVAVARPVSGMIAAPRPFSWTASGTSAGRRRFQVARTGKSGFRVLVIGSVGGDDPMAITLVDQLTRALHSDSQILGGFQTTVVRTLNPDGAATKSKLNALGEYINHGFPASIDESEPKGSETAGIPEAQFLMQLVREERPDRVIHIRSVAGDKGLIGFESSTRKGGMEAAEWLGFRQIDLTTRAVKGSLERCFAESDDVGVLVFGIPETAEQSDLLKDYGDVLFNLMLENDLETRDLVRRRRNSESADRRNREFDRP